MRIREFRDGDEVQIQKLLSQSIRTLTQDYSKEQMDLICQQNSDIEKLRKSLNKVISYVAEQKGKIIGFGDITEKGYMWRLYIKPNYFKKGVGTQLLLILEKRAKELGFKEITLDSSISAKSFYEKHGYNVLEKRKKEIGKTILNVFFMKKILA